MGLLYLLFPTQGNLDVTKHCIIYLVSTSKSLLNARGIHARVRLEVKAFKK